MHEIAIRQEIIERVVKRRGRVHLFERLDPARTAAVYIDMQVTFLAPGAPVEVPMARAIVPQINALNARLRALGVRIYWIAHANTSREGASDWPGFFDHFALARIGSRRGRYDPLQEPLQRADRGLLVAGDDGARPRRRHAAHRRKTDVCCESTARDAMMLDFVMLADCCAGLSLETIIQQFGDVMTADEALGALESAKA